MKRAIVMTHSRHGYTVTARRGEGTAAPMVYECNMMGKYCERWHFSDGETLYLQRVDDGNGSLRKIPERCRRLRREIDSAIMRAFSPLR